MPKMNWWKKIKSFLTITPKNGIHFFNLQGGFTFNSAAEMHESIFSAVNRMSNMLASLPLTLYDKDYNQPTDCQEFNLLNNGFRYFSKFDWLKDVDVLRCLTGNGYMMKFRDMNGKVVDYGLVRPNCCEPLIDLESGELYYAISAVDNRLMQQTMYVHSSEILHFKSMRFSGIKGINPINLLQNSLDYDQKVRQISLDQLVGNNEGFIVHFDANMDEDAKGELVKQIASFYKENGGLLIEENGTEIKRIERELVDTNLINVDKVTRSRVAMVYNLPEHFLGDTASSYASLEQLNLEFLTGNLLPTLVQYEQELSRKLLTDTQRAKGYRFKFDVRELLRSDTATTTAYIAACVRNSIMSPNDGREFIGLPPSNDPNANKLWISGDLYPIDTPIAERKGGVTKNEDNSAKTTQ
jgi:HK97 family phage portal protein